MSAPVQTDENPSMFPTMYAPPWAREEKRDIPGDAGMAAVDKALNASEALRRTLPPAAPLELADGKRRWRDKPFEGDIAVRSLRERGSLEPVAVPMPPVEEGSSNVGMLARVAGAVGLAALAAFFVVGAMPQPLQGLTKPAQPKAIVPQPAMAERVVASAEPIAFADRVAAVPAKADLPPAVPARAVPADPPAPPAPPPPPILRSLDQAEIEMLVKRSEALIAQGDIAAARLMLTRAAEAGDARAALVLAGTFDADILRKLGVLGVAGNAAQARTWYAKAAEYGSGEASRRLEQLAQSAR
jgi:hypothetical protein